MAAVALLAEEFGTLGAVVSRDSAFVANSMLVGARVCKLCIDMCAGICAGIRDML